MNSPDSSAWAELAKRVATATVPLLSIREDQARRWKIGDRVPVEEYLSRFAILSDKDALVLIVAEILLRREFGESPTLAEYMGRFPRLASDLNVQFPLLPDQSTAEFATRVQILREPSNETLQWQTETLELGPYLLRDMLGRGGMGEVYRAWHKLLRREDAVKVVRSELSVNPGTMRRFLLEAETAAKLRHPHVVQVYTADQSASGYYIAMEFVPGSDLRKLVNKSGPLSVTAACEYVRQAAEGVEHAHMHGLVHRDIKPENLLVTTDGRTVKVTDFGLVRSVIPTEAEVTASGVLLGTADFMAPEQANDARSVDTRSDIYSLGCTLYFLLTGTVPYPGGNLLEKLMRHATEPAPSVEDSRPDVPANVTAVIRKCMAKRPDDRYQTPRELVAALRDVSLTERPAAQNVTHVTSSEANSQSIEAGQIKSGSTLTNPSGQFSTHRRSNRRWLWAGAAVLTLSMTTGLVLLLGYFPERVFGQKDKKTDPSRTEPKQVPQPEKLISPIIGTKLPTGVPVPRSNATLPWVFSTACWSERTEKISAAGFLPNGSICSTRLGWKTEGAIPCYRECWPAEGGDKPTHSGSPSELKNDEHIILVESDRSLYTGCFQRFHPHTLQLMSSLSRDVDSVGPGGADGIDRLCGSGNNAFVTGSIRPSSEVEQKVRLVLQWNAETGNIRTGWQVPTAHNLLAVASDFTGDHIAVGTWDAKVFLLTTAGGVKRTWTAPSTRKGEPNSIRSVAISPDGKFIYTAHVNDPVILIWDCEKETHVGSIPVGWEALQLAISPNGRWLVAVGSGINVCDLHATPPQVHSLTDAWTGSYLTASFDSNSRRLLVGGWASIDGTEKGHGVVWLWDLK
ncbi:MAG: protein kinase [Gemmataceae bacterium]